MGEKQHKSKAKSFNIGTDVHRLKNTSFDNVAIDQYNSVRPKLEPSDLIYVSNFK